MVGPNVGADGKLVSCVCSKTGQELNCFAKQAELEQEYPDVLAMTQSDSLAPPPENASLTSNAPTLQDDITPPPLE